MGTVVKYDNIFQYNESRGVETQHPLVSVIDFSKAEPVPSRPLPPLLRILRRFPQGREVRRFALRT